MNVSIKFEIFERFMAIINIYKNDNILRVKSINDYASKDEFNDIIMISHIQEAVTGIIMHADYKPSEDMVEKMYIALIEKILDKHDDILAYMTRICDTGYIIMDNDMHKYMGKFIRLLNEALIWITIGSDYTVAISEELYKKAEKELLF